MILLFTPPFQRTERDPGYIKGYPPGIRENGGQYTHAALWAIWAFAQLGQGERAVDLFHRINPIYHSSTLEKVERYRVEPYVVAADVYSVAPYIGRGGWTWYTGSASWMYRLGLEMLLGLRRSGDTLQIHPSIPESWPAYQINYRFGTSMYHIQVNNQPDTDAPNQILMDGKTLAEASIPLTDDGQKHEIIITLTSHENGKMIGSE